MDGKHEEEELALVIESNIATHGSDLRAQLRHGQTLETFMHELQSSVYTTFVTMDAKYVAQLSFHVKRLLHGLHALAGATVEMPQAAAVRTTVCHWIDAAVRWAGRADAELQFVMALVAGAGAGGETRVRVHVSRAGRMAAALAWMAVSCGGAPRAEPAVKNARWFGQRRALQEQRAHEAGETVLVRRDAAGHTRLYEGLVTNVFVVTDQLLVLTARDDDVLPGSTRALVLQRCAQLRVRVRLEAPRLRDWRRWAALFVTNARRGVVAVSAVLTPPRAADADADDDDDDDDAVPPRFELPRRGRAVQLVNAIRDGVLAAARRDAYCAAAATT